MSAAPEPVYSSRIYSGPRMTNEQLREQKLTVDEVAKILRVSRMTVYRLLKPAAPGLEPALRSYRMSRTFRIPISAVRDYLQDVSL